MSQQFGVKRIGDATRYLALQPVKPLRTIQHVRYASHKTEAKSKPTTESSSESATSDGGPKTTKHKKTMAELDEELRMKMEGKSGEGGEAGLELEEGRPAAMKRGVRNNMFRLI
ncbi:MAG: hypothetical protein L6R36_002189 [Xanthoria steineri]|nr:MAG: hypothetical protein L6R36_002189 [Xanthoria steineri]